MRGARNEDRRWTEEDARRILAEWEASGQTLSAFARTAGLVPQRLSWWRKRLADRTPEATPTTEETPVPAFLPIEIVGGAVDARAAMVITTGDLRLEVEDPGLVPPAWIAELVSELRGLRS